MNRKRDKVIVIFLIIILAILFFNLASTFIAMTDYESRKEDGNERWRQVENRILQIEEAVEEWKK